LCNGYVQWLLERDHQTYYHYGTIASSQGKAMIRDLGIRDDTVVLVQGDWVYTHADVAIQVGRQLGGIYKVLASIASLCPTPLRDTVYRWVARNRYRWFGKYEACPIPDADLRARLIDL
jgi:predicted DCC family thiol-disulfide oxidoreductase YuxK